MEDLSKGGNKCIYCGARADRITINYDYICPDCKYKPVNTEEGQVDDV